VKISFLPQQGERMDITKKYIKMRLASIPDMGLGEKPLKPYHFVCGIPDLSKQVVIDLKGNWYHIITTISEVCQLERQDQLQEMVDLTGDYDNNYPNWMLVLSNFVDFLDKPNQANSMEQLWLAFVMFQKFNKIWNGEEWI